MAMLAPPPPASSPAAERLARWVVAAATIWFTLAISWGLFGRIAAGHEAVVASRGIAAENMLAWHIWAPVREYTLERPVASHYYAHHPWGSFWAIAAAMAALGRHAYVPRLVAILTSAAAPPLLYGIGRNLWGPLSGALAAVAYATLPITLAFGNFPGFEVPLVTACLLVTWGYMRFAHTQRLRWAAVSLLGVVACVNADWEANVFLVAAIAICCALAFFSQESQLGRSEARQLAQWSMITVFVAVAVGLAYVVYFQMIDALGGLMTQAARRSGGNGSPLFEVLRERQYWIDLTFTPLAILTGKIALALLLWRVFVLRRLLEVFPLALLTMAVVEYVQFKNGADVHIYWPYPFAPYYALSVGLVGKTLTSLARAAVALSGRARWASRVSLLAFATTALVPLAILPDGVRALHYARMTGGRFNERGRPTFREADKSQALEWMAERMPAHGAVALHQSMRPSWAQAWALHRPSETVNDVPLVHSTGDQRYLVADLDFVTSTDQLKLAHAFPLSVVGHYALADRGGVPAPAQGFAFDEREPTFWEWYLLSGVDPVRTIRPDPFLTWELREHYAQLPNPPPTEEPRTCEQIRVAHNVAVSAGDEALARTLRDKLVARALPLAPIHYSDGTELLAAVYEGGVEPRLLLYFLASGPASIDYQYEVTSVIDLDPRWSLVRRDERSKQLGTQFPLPMKLWKKGFIYVQENEIRHRPGRERYIGYFNGSASDPPPHPTGGAAMVTLLTLP